MLLDNALRRNPEMIAAAIELHPAGEIPEVTKMIDLELDEVGDADPGAAEPAPEGAG